MDSEKDKKTFGGCVLLAGGLLVVSIIGLALGGTNLGQFRFIFLLFVVALLLYFRSDITDIFRNKGDDQGL